MHYENGCWALQEGTQIFYPAQAYEITKTEKSVKVYGPSVLVTGPGSTLGGVNLTLEITSPWPEVFRVRTYHHKGGLKKTPEFEIEYNDQCLVTEEDEKELKISSGTLTLTIQKQPFTMTYSRNGEYLTKSGPKDLCFVKEEFRGMMYDKPGNAHMSESLALGVGECVYGLGEHFGQFVKNGQTVVIRNEDGGTSTDQAYKNIPFYMTNKGYGVFVNHPETVEFEVGTYQVAKCGFSVEGEELDYFLINGPSMKEVLKRYTDLLGKPAMPPQWSFGLWLSTSFTTHYDTDTVMSFVNGMLDRDIPLSVFHFDCCWMREFHWTDFVWDSRIFDDPAGLIKKLHEKGLHVCVWINSYIGQESVLFDEGKEKGYLLKRKDGSVWQWDMWQPGLAIVDFTNPEAVAWYQDKLRIMMDMGVDAFKTDFGERIPVEDVAWFDGSDPRKMHNYYAYIYNQAVYDEIVRYRGEGEAVVFARSATAGCQKFPVHWGGDCWSDYDSMAQSLRGGLSFAASGFGFWAHDIGGFEDRSTPDVYKRWLAFGLLSTHSRLHGSSSYRVPWLYDEESVDVCRYFTKLKLQLLPYLYNEALTTHETGVPMLRPMILEYNEDPTVRYLDKQYFLGGNLLVSPILNEEGISEYYLPEGTWTNYLTGEVTEGKTWRNEHHDYFSLPLWVKENSILATGFEAPEVGYAFEKNLEFKVYALKDRASALVRQDGKTVAELALKKNGEKAEILKKTGTEGCVLRFVGAHVTVEGYACVPDGEDTLVNL